MDNNINENIEDCDNTPGVNGLQEAAFTKSRNTDKK